jgi:predicted porin
MKKHLIAVAILAATGAASAQSSVTLFGIVDASLAIGRGSIGDRTSLANSGNNSSRLGFRGTEDLGGGLSASFHLEAQLSNDDGRGGATNTNNQATGGALAGINGGQGLTFNRRSTVSLAGGWGELRLGRDYNPQFWNLSVFDPFTTNGVGTNQVLTSSTALSGPINVRSSNAISYFLPRNLGGFYGQVQYYLGENLSNAANSEDGTGMGVRAGYASGPLNVAVAVARTRYATGDLRQSNIGGQWNFGVARLSGEYSRDQVASPVAVNGRGGLIGGVLPVGAGEVKLSYSTYRLSTAGNPRTTKIALGYVHNLSKRTALYATYAHLRNSGGAALALNASTTAANAGSSGYDFGVRHSF